MVYRICILGLIAVLLSACVRGNPTVTHKQYTAPHLARLVLPLTPEQQPTQVIKVSANADNKVIVEQHAFNGGRVSVIFDNRYPVTLYSGKAEILDRIIKSPFVTGFIGTDAVMGVVKDHDETSIANINRLNPDAGGDIKYALVTNRQKTKICAVFTMYIIATDNVLSSYLLGYQSTVIDGALCNSVQQKNAVAMENYVRQFMTVINKR